MSLSVEKSSWLMCMLVPVTLHTGGATVFLFIFFSFFRISFCLNFGRISSKCKKSRIKTSRRPFDWAILSQTFFCSMFPMWICECVSQCGQTFLQLVQFPILRCEVCGWFLRFVVELKWSGLKKRENEASLDIRNTITIFNCGLAICPQNKIIISKWNKNNNWCVFI